MTLLFITQKLHGQDAFVIHWVRAFQKRGYIVTVLCLEKRVADTEVGFPILSMGKERGISRMRQLGNFLSIILREHPDRIFIHMSPVWYALGFWLWFPRRTPVYLWYTHYRMQLGVALFGIFGKRFFCASQQSLPQYDGNPKKIVTGHGIDLDLWKKRSNECNNPHALLVVHRLSRSKRVEITLRALALLPSEYTMEIYGIEAEPDYVKELRAPIFGLGLSSRVRFMGSIPMTQLPAVYSHHRLIVNMASETIDKTMLEAMTCGCFPVTTRRNAVAIGIENAPDDDSPEEVARFIRNFKGAHPDELYQIVARRHSLDGLVQTMDGYIKMG